MTPMASNVKRCRPLRAKGEPPPVRRARAGSARSAEIAVSEIIRRNNRERNEPAKKSPRRVFLHALQRVIGRVVAPLWIPLSVHYCGELNIHDMVWGEDGLVGVNTLFSCLFRLDEKYSFAPVAAR